MEKMTDAEWREFVMTGTRTGKLGVVRADGRPHVTPIWFVLDRDDVVFTTHESGVKGKSLRRDPRVVLCVDDETPPFSYVMIEGIVTLSSDQDELLRWTTEIGGRYMGRDRADEFGRRNGVPGEWLVRLRVGKVVADRGVAD
ncbi:PPOX class F420-dependent oxidoreductase [Streptosporangium sp. NPDC002721]|uniref:PPOX class F420-dependent oxidoreductase n=1 Tax=Streptosporangium sp. NPDC002721 TaxID=3366188 RepID=UPI00367D50FB